MINVSRMRNPRAIGLSFQSKTEGDNYPKYILARCGNNWTKKQHPSSLKFGWILLTNQKCLRIIWKIIINDIPNQNKKNDSLPP